MIVFNSKQGIGKSKSILINSEQRQNAVLNAKQFEWAKIKQENAIYRAKSWLMMDNEHLLSFVTDQSITRDIHTNTVIGCPNCGKGINGFGNYPWEQAGEWKLQCPNCCKIFPENDFSMFLRFGRDSLSDYFKLINEIVEIDSVTNLPYFYDFEFGMLDSNGNQHNFIAYYNHWYNWRGFVVDALQDLSNAYTLTNDNTYAEKAGLIVAKILSVYPSLDYEHQDATFKNRSHYFKGIGGFATDRIWETGIVNTILRAYDLIFDGVMDNKKFFNKINSLKILSKNIENIDDFNSLFIENFIYKVDSAIKSGRISPNLSGTNLNYSYLITIFDNDSISRELNKYVFSSSYAKGNSTSYLLSNGIDRYGIGNECGDYGLGWSRRLKGIVNLIFDYENINPNEFLMKYPKVKQLYTTEYNLRVLDKFLPPLGDLMILNSWRKNIAQKDSTSIFGKDGLKEQKGDFRGSISIDTSTISYIRSDYGQSVLQRKNEHSDGVGVWIHHGGPKGHSHADNLTYGLIGFDFDLLPDIGYPDYANFTAANSHRWAWTSNTFSHNTLLVDDKRSRIGAGGIIDYIYHSNDLQSLQVNSNYAYDSIDLYQRTLFLVEVDDTNAYCVDVFRASGGNTHRLSYHSASENVTFNGIKTYKQNIGSFAGANIDFRHISDEEKKKHSNANGLSFLRNVERSRNYVSNNYDVSWECKDVLNRLENYENLFVKIYSLNNLDEVAFATGENPTLRGDILPTFRYMIQSRFGANLKSQYVNIVEPFRGKSIIKEAYKVSHKHSLYDTTNSVFIKIALENGYIDYIFSCNINDTIITDDFKFIGKSGYLRIFDNTIVDAKLIKGTLLKYMDFVLTNNYESIKGTVASIDYSDYNNNYIVVNSDFPLDRAIIGSYIHIKNSDRYDNSYEIKDIQENKIFFGDITLVKGYIDKKDYSKGFSYYVNPGDKFEIPVFKSLK